MLPVAMVTLLLTVFQEKYSQKSFKFAQFRRDNQCTKTQTDTDTDCCRGKLLKGWRS
jgi:hypothetical protein